MRLHADAAPRVTVAGRPAATDWLVVVSAGLYVIQYQLTPQSLVHPQWSTSFSIDTLARSLLNRSVYGPLLDATLSPQLAAFAALAVLARGGQAALARYLCSVALFVLGIGAMLGTAKIADATQSVFFAGARFWLAIPYGLLCFNVQAVTSSPSPTWSFQRYASPAILVIVLALCAGGSLAVTRSWLAAHAEQEIGKRRPVMAGRRSDVLASCRTWPGRSIGESTMSCSGPERSPRVRLLSAERAVRDANGLRSPYVVPADRRRS